MSEHSYEVAIIGSGVIGMELAILLKEAGINVAIFERQAKAYPLPRAATLDGETLRLFHSSVESQVGPNIEPLLDPGVKNDFVWRDADMQPLASLSWSKIGPSGYPTVRPFNQPSMEKALDQICRKLEIPIYREQELYYLEQDADSVNLLFSHFTLNAPSVPFEERKPTMRVRTQYCVGADGANSQTRRLCKLPEKTLPFTFDFLIADLLPDLPEPEETLKYVPSQICDPKRPLTIVFGGPGRRRFEFMRLPHETKEELVKDDKVFELIKKWGYTPANCKIERAVVYTFAAKWAETWQSGRVFLAGDSAHLTPPFIGQGMNSGVRDASNLAWRLQAVMKQQASTKILDSYTSERLPHVIHLTMMAVDSGEVICETDPEKAKVIQDELKATGIRSDPPLLGPGLFYGNKALNGSLAVHGRIRHNGREDLADQIFGRRGWTLITIEGPEDPLDLLDEDGKQLFRHLNGISFSAAGNADVTGRYAEWFSQTLKAKAVIVRPDFYIYGYGDISEVASMVKNLKSQLGL